MSQNLCNNGLMDKHHQEPNCQCLIEMPESDEPVRRSRRRSWPPVTDLRDPGPVIFLPLQEELSNTPKQRVTTESGSFLTDSKSKVTLTTSLDRERVNEIKSVVETTPRVAEDANSTVTSARTLRKRRIASIFQHYYPEGGWGYVVLFVSFFIHLIANGLPFSFVLVIPVLSRRFKIEDITLASLVGVVASSVSFIVSPFVIAVCRRNSTRLTSVFGGLVTALGCLFSSFATEPHQIFISFGIILGIGVGLTRDPASLMVCQYFKRRRALVEIFLVASSGIGMSLVTFIVTILFETLGWRLGLQSVTALTFILFILGTFFRSASLYHPQRRAILHLKSQKRKVKSKDKEKNKLQDDRPPFFDFATLRSKTVRIILLSIGVSSFGIQVPMFNIVQQASRDGLRGRHLIWIQSHLGISWAVGCILFGTIVVNNSTDCRISKQYLCQGGLFLTGVSILAFTAAEGFSGYMMFVWVHGFFSGGYNYALKMYINEKVRARNFARAWGFAQFSMAISNLIGVPIAGYLSIHMGSNSGFIFAGTTVIIGSLLMALIDVHKRRLRCRKHACRSKTIHVGLHPSPSIKHSDKDNEMKHMSNILDIEVDRHSFSDQDDILPPVSLLGHQRSFVYEDLQGILDKGDSICSEEGLADLDAPHEYLLDDYDYDYLDNITSCAKVENNLMLSEYEQNLIKETEGPNLEGPRRWANRKWSMFRAPAMPTINSESEPSSTQAGASTIAEVAKSVSEVSESSGSFLSFAKNSFTRTKWR